MVTTLYDTPGIYNTVQLLTGSRVGHKLSNFIDWLYIKTVFRHDHIADLFYR